MEILINDDEYHEILSIFGYPIIDEDDIEYSSNDIKKLMIYPAMRTYFQYFHIR